MSSKQLLAPILTAAGLVGCANAEMEIEYPSRGIPLVWLELEEVISTDAPSTLAYEIDADPESGRLVLLDFYADRPVVIMEPDGQVVARVGSRGEGPGEFEDLRSVTVSEGRAYVWDGTQNRVTSIDIANPVSATTEVTIPNPLRRLILEVEPLSDGSILAIGKMGDHLALRYSDPAAEGVPLGSAPPSLGGDPEQFRIYNSQASAIVSEEKNLLVVGYLSLGEMVFARLSTGEHLETTKAGAWPTPKLVRRGGPGNWRNSLDNFVGYRTVDQSPLGVWGLFHGNTWRRDWSEYRSQDVHAFSWDGELRYILRVSRMMAGLAVLGNYLYACVNDPTPAVVRWRIPDHVLDELRAASRMRLTSQ